MPPKVKINREMIIDAAFEIVRESGEENNYIRFSVNEKNLFRFLFQSNAFSGRMQGLVEDERLMPVLQVMGSQMGIGVSDVKKYFEALYYPVHGIASLLANNSMEYDEDEFETVLSMIKSGVLKELGREKDA